MKKNEKNPPRPTLSPACALIGRFRAVPGGISERMLSAALRDLERAGLVARRVYPEVPPRVEYATTPKTESLMPILRQLLDWARENA